MPEQFFTTKQIAKILQLSDRTIREMIKDSELPAYHIRNEWRISESQLNEYLKSRQQTDKETQQNQK